MSRVQDFSMKWVNEVQGPGTVPTSIFHSSCIDYNNLSLIMTQSPSGEQLTLALLLQSNRIRRSTKQRLRKAIEERTLVFTSDAEFWIMSSSPPSVQKEEDEGKGSAVLHSSKEGRKSSLV
jgi:hypothetical protein